MGYRNKTYVIFDGDNDMWAYGFMKGWKSNENVSFNFYDAHDLNVITDRASEETVKRKLRERFSSAKQIIVVIGEHTKNLYRFVRWEIEIALNLNLPIIAVNLNGKREYDPDRCPAILRGKFVVHVPFKAIIIQHALDNFPIQHAKHDPNEGGDLYYVTETYKSLGL